MPDTMLIPNMEYKTWDSFKRDLESKLGRGLPVDWWLHTKPKKPLPWYNADLQTTLSEVLKIQQSLSESKFTFGQVGCINECDT